MTRRRGRGLVGVVVGVAALLASCGSPSGPAACGPTVREQLDPQSFVHLLDAADVDYLTDPPTSGAHLVGVTLTGVSESPLAPAVQVSLLEQGLVLLQYAELTSTAVAELESLAGPEVVVAPNPELPSPVVATAWLIKQRCEAVDTEALAAFVAEHAAPGQPPHSDDEPAS